jgi:hypothetical protein
MIASLRYIAAFRHKQPSYFLNSSNTEVKHGDRFPMFENKTAWHGDSLNKGANIASLTAQIQVYFGDITWEQSHATTHIGLMLRSCVIHSKVYRQRSHQ